MMRRQTSDIDEKQIFDHLRKLNNYILSFFKEDGLIILLKHHSGDGCSRIDESNMKNILKRAKESLSDEEFAMVKKAKLMMQKRAEQIVERYIDWGFNIGLPMAAKYGIDRIEAKSEIPWAIYKAAFRYVPDKTFASYATHWIRQVLERAPDRRMLLTLNNTRNVHSGNGEGDMSEHIDFIESKEKDVVTEMSNTHIESEMKLMIDCLDTEEKTIVQDWWDYGVNNDHEAVKQLATALYKAN